MVCKNCGEINKDGANFCESCGSKLKQTSSSTSINLEKYTTTKAEDNSHLETNENDDTTQSNHINNININQQNGNGQRINGDYNVNNPYVASDGKIYDSTPITMWGYFGYNLLFLIPIVGTIIAIIMAFGGTRNINLRNYARSMFCIWIVVIVLSIMSIGCTACTLSSIM